SGDMRVAALDLTLSRTVLGDSASSHGSRLSSNINWTMIAGNRSSLQHYASRQRWGHSSLGSGVGSMHLV
ncbi:hypothetical protein, partial [Roseiconus nitratireducens]|uniref:hypothetical protein n=1 Tax=Roseiconus nitratireducens TaxID=2605748 RepID=UPI001F1C9225